MASEAIVRQRATRHCGRMAVVCCVGTWLSLIVHPLGRWPMWVFLAGVVFYLAAGFAIALWPREGEHGNDK